MHCLADHDLLDRFRSIDLYLAAFVDVVCAAPDVAVGVAAAAAAAAAVVAAVAVVAPAVAPVVDAVDLCSLCHPPVLCLLQFRECSSYAQQVVLIEVDFQFVVFLLLPNVLLVPHLPQR